MKVEEAVKRFEVLTSEQREVALFSLLARLFVVVASFPGQSLEAALKDGQG
jgi:hypothetical protein